MNLPKGNMYAERDSISTARLMGHIIFYHHTDNGIVEKEVWYFVFVIYDIPYGTSNFCMKIETCYPMSKESHVIYNLLDKTKNLMHVMKVIFTIPSHQHDVQMWIGLLVWSGLLGYIHGAVFAD